MIPLKDNLRARELPVLVIALITINLVVFALDRISGGYVTYHIQQGPYIYRQIAFQGGLEQNYALVPAHLVRHINRYWPTIFTSMFLHANWLHIGGNMLFLWVFGFSVEEAIGKTRFLILYFVSGIAAALAQVFSNPSSHIAMIGASGAIAGLMGAYLMLFPGARIYSIVPIFFLGFIMQVPAPILILFWAFLQYVDAGLMHSPGLGGVAYFAHLGGFSAGIVLIVLMGGRRLGYRLMSRQRRYGDH